MNEQEIINRLNAVENTCNYSIDIAQHYKDTARLAELIIELAEHVINLEDKVREFLNNKEEKSDE